MNIFVSCCLPGWAEYASKCSRPAGSRPGGRHTFSCFAKRKYAKRRRAGFVGPLRGHAALLGSSGKLRNSPCGLRHLRFFIRLPLRYSPPNSGGDTARPTADYRNRTPQVRAMARTCLNSGFRMFGFPRRPGRAEQRSSGRIRAGVCLSPQGEFSPTPSDASSARNPEGALTAAVFSFGYLSLDKQRKVPRPPGRDPACLAPSGARPGKATSPGAKPAKETNDEL